jgi:hypothetical protein
LRLDYFRAGESISIRSAWLGGPDVTKNSRSVLFMFTMRCVTPAGISIPVPAARAVTMPPCSVTAAPGKHEKELTRPDVRVKGFRQAGRHSFLDYGHLLVFNYHSRSVPRRADSVTEETFIFVIAGPAPLAARDRFRGLSDLP